MESGSLDSIGNDDLQNLFCNDEVRGIESEILYENDSTVSVLVIIKTASSKKVGLDPIELVCKDSKWKIKQMIDGKLPIALEQTNYRSYDDFITQYCLGNIYFKLNRYQDAVKYFTKSLQIKGDFPEAYWALGLVYIKLRQYDIAAEIFKKGIAINPGSSSLHYNLGNTYLRLDRLVEALKSFNDAIRLQPDLVEAYGGTGVALCRLGNFKKAINAFNHVIQSKPNRESMVLAYANRGFAYSGLQQFANAVDDFSKAIELDSTNASAYVGLAIVYYIISKKEKSFEYYQKAIKFEPMYKNRISYLNKEGLYYSMDEILILKKIIVEMEF
jgi:tetratricopeptide (TPR) repeat protein